MAVPEVASLLAGFVLAHATWSVSDLPKGEVLIPFAIVEAEGKREMSRFIADSQDQSIEKGKEFVTRQQASASAWALAKESQVNTNKGKVDVLVVETWQKGMKEPMSYIQPFQPYASGTFKLLGPAIPVVSGSMIDTAHSKPYLDILYRGVSSHPKAASLWSSWQ